MKSILPLKIDRVWFKNAEEILLENITLSIEKGLPKILMGANGSGKTLLMRVAHGLLTPTQGRVSWADNRKNFGSVRQTMVFQKPIMLRRTVKENLLFALNAIENDRTIKEQLVQKALSEVNLAHKADAYAPTLSQGEQQKLAIIRACLLKPEVLFLDEPTSNIDPHYTREIESLIRAISNQGTQIIMATHNIDQAKRINGEILFMKKGRLIDKRNANEFFANIKDSHISEFLTFSK
ncbi:ATP-binding cassette domain-containing protein [Betaproteobacteria bacterium]|nr:ATP-binding cassette domain-containing protein [Betaproteobacteria bacterium]